MRMKRLSVLLAALLLTVLPLYASAAESSFTGVVTFRSGKNVYLQNGQTGKLVFLDSTNDAEQMSAVKTGKVVTVSGVAMTYKQGGYHIPEIADAMIQSVSGSGASAATVSASLDQLGDGLMAVKVRVKATKGAFVAAGVQVSLDQYADDQLLTVTGVLSANAKGRVLLGAKVKAEATPTPDSTPTPVPTAAPTPAPTAAPTSTAVPTPTEPPTQAPTEPPNPAPTEAPTPVPTDSPTPEPTSAATPTVAPTPTEAPTQVPTESAAPASTDSPTPSADFTAVPTAVPTDSPTPEPASAATPSATVAPTASPTILPVPTPTAAPTAEPKVSPSPSPTFAAAPTAGPTVQPTAKRTKKPADRAAPTPTAAPSSPVPDPTEAASAAAPAIQPTLSPAPASTPAQVAGDRNSPGLLLGVPASHSDTPRSTPGADAPKVTAMAGLLFLGGFGSMLLGCVYVLIRAIQRKKSPAAPPSSEPKGR